MAIFIPTTPIRKGNVKEELAKIEARGESFELTKKDAEKSRKRRSSRSSSRRRAAQEKAILEQLKRDSDIKKAKDKELKRIEASKILQTRIEKRALEIRLEKIEQKKSIEEKKKKDILKGSFKKGIEKQKQFLTKSQRDIRFGITPTKAGERIAKKYISVSPTTSKIIKTNPKVLNVLVDQQKLTDRTIKELRIAGLEVTRTFVDFVEFSPEVVKFLTVNNPAWNKKNRDTISKAIIKYTPKVASWAKGVVTDKEKFKLSVAAVGAFGLKQLKIVKTQPGKAFGRVGGEWVLYVASAGAWKAVKIIDNKATRGLLKVGNKWIKGSEVLNAIAKKGGKVVKGLEIVGKDIVVSTKKTLGKVVKKVSGSKLIKAVKKEIKKLESKVKVKLTTKQKKLITDKIRQGKFTKVERNKIRQELARLESKIKGVKVTRKEFESFAAAEREFNNLRKTRKFATKIKQQGGAGVSQRVSKKSISVSDRNLLQTFKQLPASLKVNVDKLSFTTFSQKFVTDIPVLKRIGGIKNGVWRVIFKQKTFYQNTVSISMFNKAGKGLGTFSYNTIATKPIQRFRNIASALKWGRGKSVSISKQVGKDLIKTIVLKSLRGKVSQSEFLSKVKLVKKGLITDVDIVTRTIGGSPVSKTASRIIETTQRGKTFTKKGVLKIIDSPKVIEKIKSASIINPVVIDTSRIDIIIKTLNKIKVKSLTIGKKKMIKSAQNRVRIALKKGGFRFKGKNKVVISKQRLIQLEKVSKELQKTTALKQSLAAASIPKSITIPKRIEGLTNLKKLIRAEKRLRLLTRNRGLSVAEQRLLKVIIAATRTAQVLSKTLAKAKNSLQQNKIISDVSKLQKSITSRVSKTTTKTATLIKTILKPVVLLPRITGVQIRPKKKISPLRLRRKDEELLNTKTLSKPTQVFNVVIKKRGRNVILNKRLIERDAQNFMALELDTTLIRTARLVPAGVRKVVTKLPRKYAGAFTKRKKKFRTFRIKRKKKIAIRGYIEKRKYSLDTKKERMQLSRLIKKGKKKRKANKRRTTRTTRRKKRK